MKGDFSKMTYAPDKNFLRVLMQQGRVQLDADWNEQTAILLHYMQTLAADLIGPHGGPAGYYGFKIGAVLFRNGIEVNVPKGDFSIGKGRYYVNGILCENHHNITYFGQPDYPLDAKTDVLNAGSNYLVYLDVWERHITYLEDDDIREKALNGVDTATRSKVVWQVKVKELNGDDISCEAGARILNNELALSEACLCAQIKSDNTKLDACCQHPDAKYRGAENQLYRIEIHNDGRDGNLPTFKWSRENGSVVFPVTNITQQTEMIIVELEHLGRDDKLSLAVNDWVELVNDDSVLKNTVNPLPLYQVHAIDPMTKTVELTGTTSIINDKSKHILLRRWDQKNGDANGIVIKCTDKIGEMGMNGQTDWLPIEAGIEVTFKCFGDLRNGDYWLIPARTTGELEWPNLKGIDAKGNEVLYPAFVKPNGVEHHYAPLAIIEVGEGGVIINVEGGDCRHSFDSSTPLPNDNDEIPIVDSDYCNRIMRM